MAASAEAAPYRRYPARVQKVLEHLQRNPIQLKSIPMIYEPSQGTPVPDVVAGLTPQDVLPANTPESPQAQHTARVIAGMLYLACGGLDEAHNLVTPLCWGSPTHYGGPPISGSSVASEAAYAHALVHLLEGDAVGEFGTGYSNANYWYSAAGRTHAIHPQLLEAAKKLAGSDPELQKFVENHGAQWQPQRLVALCQRSSGEAGSSTKAFCEAVVNAEWRLLLDYCYSRLPK